MKPGPGTATPDPPTPFDPDVTTLEVGTVLYRVHGSGRSATAFNPGVGGPTRFAFFADDGPGGTRTTVPILYAAATEQAAVAETLLHDVPLSGGTLRHDDYAGRVMSRLAVARPVRLAALHGLGLRRLGVRADQVTSSPATSYTRTVGWAAAAHRAGLDGVAWMSRQSNDAAAYVLFGDRRDDALEQDPTFGRVFATGADLLWLIDLCAPLRVDVLPPPPT